MDKYQRFSKEWNQVAGVHSVKSKTFKEAAEVLGSTSSTVIRCFKKLVKVKLNEGVHLPKYIAIDEYKGDRDAGTYHLIIANDETHEPINILPNRRKETTKDYLMKYGADVEVVVIDMNQVLKQLLERL